MMYQMWVFRSHWTFRSAYVLFVLLYCIVYTDYCVCPQQCDIAYVQVALGSALCVTGMCYVDTCDKAYDQLALPTST